jgi:pathogenesis-related protein 1
MNMVKKCLMIGCLLLSYMPLVSAAPDAIAEGLVKGHNEWRKKVGVPPVKWSKEIAKVAQNYANSLAKQGCAMEHSQTDLGENIYWASAQRVVKSNGKQINQPQSVTGEMVVNDWGSESQDYDPVHHVCKSNAVCGHYTQVVWANSTLIGCGRAYCADSAQIWVCNYSPAGNFEGEKPF